MATWHVDVKSFYVRVYDKIKKKEVSKLIIQRKMYVECAAVIDSGIHRIFAMKNNYSLATIPRIPQSHWTNPTGKCETWYKLPPDLVDDEGNILRPYKAVRRLTETELLGWLTVIFGQEQAKICLHSFKNAMPAPRREAA